MTNRLLTALALALCLILGSVASADAARRKATPAPTITSIKPLEAQVGQKLVVTGRNFLPGRNKTRVFFLRGGGGAVFARAESASKTRLVVTIPDSVTPLLRQVGTELKPTRFQLRILARKFGKPSVARRSPIISAADVPTGPGGGGGGGGGTSDTGVPPDGDCDGDGVTNSLEADDDNDLLGDAQENGETHTDPCDADTDSDAVEDGYEYESAKDLNERPIPYPGKRPYPNPLDADATTDYDGDGLQLVEEHGLWRRYGGHAFPLNYSDGTQWSNPVPAPDPADVVHHYVDMDGNGLLSDDEKDADGDELTNWDETGRGRMSMIWWEKAYGRNPFNEKKYPELSFVEPDMTDPDTDGDTVLDGLDDQDHDGYTNRFEVERPGDWLVTYVSVGPPPAPSHNPPVSPGVFQTGSNPWARVNPFNPCKPIFSGKCHLHEPFGYYGEDEDWKGVPPPAGIPTPSWPGGYSAP